MLFVIAGGSAFAQPKQVTTDEQVWVGYMTSVQFAKNYSLWNDFHFVPTGFGVVRTGVTRHFAKGAFTAGLARLWLPAPGSENSLTRKEWRPWGQIQFVLPVDARHVLTQRLRYDARYKQSIRQGALQENTFDFNHRVRWLVSFRRNFSTPSTSWQPFVSLNNEVLLNFGRTITYNTFDQNRISVMAGIQHKGFQVQLGYMSRFVQTGERQFSNFHTGVLWITQRFNAQSLLQHHGHEMDGE
jgi:hypothetical protein